MTVSYAAFAPPSFADHKIRCLFFFTGCLNHQMCQTPDSVKAIQARTLYHVDKMSAACKPGRFLPQCQHLPLRFSRKDTHFHLHSCKQHQLRRMLLKPFEIIFLFRADGIQINPFYIKAMGDQKSCQSHRSRMKRPVYGDRPVSNFQKCLMKCCFTALFFTFIIQNTQKLH